MLSACLENSSIHRWKNPKTESLVSTTCVRINNFMLYCSVSFHWAAHSSLVSNGSNNSPLVPSFNMATTAFARLSRGTTVAPASLATPTSGATTATPAASASTILAPQLSCTEVHKTTSAAARNGLGSCQPGNSTGKPT